MAKNAVAVKKNESNAVSVHQEVPDFMKGDAGAGTENLDSSALETPRLSLLQALSPQVEEHGARQGNYWHNLMDMEIPADVEVVPLYLEETALLWRPREDGGGILARQVGNAWSPSNTQFEVTYKGNKVVWDTSDNIAKSRLLDWGSSNPADKNSLPAATRMLNVVFAMPTYSEGSPVVFTFAKSSYGIGKKLAGRLKMSPLPSYGQRFILGSMKQNSSNGSFFVPTIKANGLVESKSEYESYKDIYRLFASRDRQIGVGTDDDHETAASDEKAF